MPAMHPAHGAVVARRTDPCLGRGDVPRRPIMSEGVLRLRLSRQECEGMVAGISAISLSNRSH